MYDLKIYNSIKEIDKSIWNSLNSEDDPFLDPHLFYALETSNLLTRETGWETHFFSLKDKGNIIGLCPAFIKYHSYGEYIFDWQIANAYQAYQIPYYPKLLSMIPFSPVSTSTFMVKDNSIQLKKVFLKMILEYYKSSPYNSINFNYLIEEELSLFNKNEFINRLSTQYHWKNLDYSNFDSFLSNLKMSKRKSIKKERLSIQKQEIQIISRTGDQLTETDAIKMYRFYSETIDKKFSYAYLNQDFFVNIFRTMKDKILFIEAIKDGETVGVTLNFYNANKLYGRYWGGKNEFKNLHFELCYYKPIEFCIKNNIKIFEAGAQGEHKISRGFMPEKIRSSHIFKSVPMSSAIREFAIKEANALEDYINGTKENGPYKTN